ncbi:CGCGG family rSAM-modified RiPP protein [Alicyclobacillaceae bacterium I2511]|nr:CGCGG family rSAM-modified RiPP protein [Alicyclobacillaceae bacterium I2511]
MGNWSINLETEEYEQDRELLVCDAKQAILDTPPGFYVNLAVAPTHGNPDSYLVPALKENFGSTIGIRFVDQCGCGGYVYKVTRLK